MSIVENDIQKLKSLQDQAAKGLQSIDPKATGNFELDAIRKRIDTLQAQLRQKESQMGAETKKDSTVDLNKLESKQKNLEMEKKKHEEDIRQIADTSLNQKGQLQSQINKLKRDLESSKTEAARLAARIQGAQSALQQAQKKLPKVVVAIEKSEREAQVKSRKRLEEKATKEIEQRMQREKKLQAEADKRLRDAEATRKKQLEENVKQQAEVKAGAGQAEKSKPDLADQEKDKSEAQKLLKRKQRAEKRLRSLQDEAHKKDTGDARRRRLQQLKGVAQRGGMSAEQKEEYSQLKAKDIKSKAK